MVTKIGDLLPCTQYSLVIGPVTNTQQAKDDTDKEEDEAIDETWIFEKDIIEVPSLTISTTRTSVSATWPALPCVDHYILRLETVGPVQGHTYGSDVVYLHSIL